MFCPSCGAYLTYEGRASAHLCGGVHRWRCPNATCGNIWKEDQTGIVGRPTNLTLDSLAMMQETLKKKKEEMENLDD